MSQPTVVTDHAGARALTPLEARFYEAIGNSVRHCKRSLLDFIDLWQAQLPPDLAPGAREFIELMKRRVHNDVSLVRSQVEACFEIYRSGGVIPPFGRTEGDGVVPSTRQGGNGTG